MYKFFPMAEGVFLTAFAVGLVLQWMDIQTSIIFISLLGLSSIYFLNAYAPPPVTEENQPQGFVYLLARVIAPKVLSISSSVCVIGILFYLTSLKGYKQMLLIGCMSIVVASFLVIIAILKNETARKVLMPLLLRAIPLAAISFFVLWREGLAIE
jgi:hypothetical protein